MIGRPTGRQAYIPLDVVLRARICAVDVPCDRDSQNEGCHGGGTGGTHVRTHQGGDGRIVGKWKRRPGVDFGGVWGTWSIGGDDCRGRSKPARLNLLRADENQTTRPRRSRGRRTHIDTAQVYRNKHRVGTALEALLKSYKGRAVDVETGFSGPEQREKVLVAT